ncbi:hypothetical protein D9M68_905680 [compost metagenome]
MAGVKRIFERLGVGALELHEHIKGRDWDVVQLGLTDQQNASFAELLPILVRMYGRTCRRYEVAVTNTMTLNLGAAEVSHDQQTLICEFGAQSTVTLSLGAVDISHESQHLTAKL